MATAKKSTKSSSTPRAAKPPTTERPKSRGGSAASDAAPHPMDSDEPTKPRRSRASSAPRPTAEQSPTPSPTTRTLSSSTPTTPPPTPASTPTAPRSSTSTAGPVSGLQDDSSTDRDALVREHAYLLAESNHFAGDPGFYWHVAERELLRSGVFESPAARRSDLTETR